MRSIHTLLVAVACLALVACGGGGGAAAPSPAPPAPAPAPSGGVPANPPAPPAVSYQGRSTSAVLDEANVGALADSLFFAIALGLDTATPPTPMSLELGETDKSIQGPAGGSARIQGRMNADGTGWYSAAYVNYRDGNVVLDGMFVDEILQVTSTGAWLSRRTSYHDFVVAVRQRSASYAGHMMLSRGPQDPVTASGNIRVRSGNGTDLMASGLVLTLRLVEDAGFKLGVELAASARVFDGTHGWVDLTFAAPWTVAQGEGLPAYGGPMIGTTEDGRALRLVSLTPDVVSLQYTSATKDRFDRAARLPWNPLFAAQTMRPRRSTPVADAGPSVSVLPGARLTLEGGYSSHAETPFLSYQWTLLFRPPGSAASLSHVNDVSPTLTLDAPGRYLLQLVVSDEIRSSRRDFVAVAADPQVDTSPVLFSSAQLAPSTTAAFGDAVVVEADLFTPRSLPLVSGMPLPIAVWGPHGDTVPTTQAGGALTFVPNEPGIYKAVLGATPTVAPGFDTQYFSVLTDLNFTPSVWIPTDDLVTHLATADVDGDGLSDIVASENARLRVFFGAPQPDLVGPVVLDGTTGDAVAIGDLTGDGRADLATPIFGGYAVFTQSPDRFFVPTIVQSSACGGVGEQIVIADINGDGRNDLAATCYLAIAYYLGRSDGTLDTERTIPIGVSDADLIAADLNDDGITDLAVTAQHGQNIGIVYGQAGTTPLAVQWLPLVAQSHDRVPQLAATDVNADGRTDLVFGGRAFGSSTDPDKVRVFHQSASGQLVEAQVIDLPYPRRALDDVSVGDFNHDGKVDIGVRSASLSFLAHYQITPGTFGEQSRAALDCANHASGDFNGDGLTDVVCGMGSTRQGAVGVMFGVRPDP